MTRNRVFFAGIVSVMLFLGFGSSAFAVLHCDDCSCFSHACTTPCSNGGIGGAVSCGDTGNCVGGFNCPGGGCLTLEDLAAAQMEPNPTTPNPDRGRVTARLTWRLTQYVEEGALGEVYAAETGLPFSTQTLAPDLAFVRHERLGAASTPDLAIEIRSAHESAAVVAAKVRTWLATGARIVLVVHPAAQTIAVHGRAGIKTLRGDDLLEIPSLLPGWAVRVGDLFEK